MFKESVMTNTITKESYLQIHPKTKTIILLFYKATSIINV